MFKSKLMNVLFSCILLLYYFILILLCLCIILIESFRVPFDIPEAESELVAGYMTENSALLFSLILLTEYTNIIYMVIMVVVFSGFDIIIMVVDFILLISIIRSAFNRILYDEMMSIC
jgi:NADH:ubiquinone oxidoreductase subunit H